MTNGRPWTFAMLLGSTSLMEIQVEPCLVVYKQMVLSRRHGECVPWKDFLDVCSRIFQAVRETGVVQSCPTLRIYLPVDERMDCISSDRTITHIKENYL